MSHGGSTELIGLEPTRRIRLLLLSALALSGVVLQGLVWWYGLQAAGEDWSVAGLELWALAVSVWTLVVGLLVALLRKRLKDVPGVG